MPGETIENPPKTHVKIEMGRTLRILKGLG
jgi:hypothetical protein